MVVAICKTCDKGQLENKKKYRMSGPVVAIGYIFLIPSILGILVGVLSLFSTVKATKDVTQTQVHEITVTLQKASVPEEIIQKVISFNKVDDSRLKALPPKQREAVRSAMLTRTASTAGTGVGASLVGGLSMLFIVFSFVGGLLGWLLIMKKKVLQCNNCGAVVQAS